ncbi:MAG: hypothetical protein FWD34_07525 [Oscillospiraceae bacterium]|nr:hypothetical protein [Oscillospiraceae bacterium]
MKVIKSNTYNVVNTEPFDIPKPLEFELLSGNSLLAAYTIQEDGRVDYSFNPGSKERILTSTSRPLDLNDIYFLLSSRVFPDKMPFTRNELDRFGIYEYNPYEIARKTHGIMPADRYWFRFFGEDLSFKKASEDFNSYFTKPVPAPATEAAPPPAESVDEMTEQELQAIFSIDSLLNQKSHEFTSINDVNSILHENTLDIESLAANIDDTPITESVFVAALDKPESSVMTPDQIAALLNKSSEPAPEPALPDSPAPPIAEPVSDSGGGGNMSPEAIAALLSSAGGGEPEPTPAPAETSSGGNMSPEAIAALLSSAGGDEPTPEPEPIPAPAETSSGGNMSPEAIAALLAGNSSEPEPTPEPTPTPAPAETSSGGNMSPEAIAALLASAGGGDE